MQKEVFKSPNDVLAEVKAFQQRRCAKPTLPKNNLKTRLYKIRFEKSLFKKFPKSFFVKTDFIHDNYPKKLTANALPEHACRKSVFKTSAFTSPE